MKATHYVTFFLLLNSCAFDALLPGSDSDGPEDASSQASEGPSESTERVCVYHSSSEYFCADGFSSFDSSVECTPATSLEACVQATTSTASCTGDCCIDSSYYGHAIFDAPCDVALAHANSSGQDEVRLVDDRCGMTIGTTSCDDCMNEQCAAECTACANEPGCLLVLDCAFGCETDSCVDSCVDFYATGYEALMQLLGENGCVAERCSSECT